MPDNDMITLGVNIDITTAEQQIAELKQSLGNLRQTIDEAPNATNAFNLGLDKAISAADMLLEKINKAYSQNNTDDNFLLNDLSAGISELSTLKNLFSDNGAFSTSIARNLFSGFSDSVKHELDTNISAISSMIKTNIGTLKSKTLAGMAGEILETADAQQLFGRFSAVNGQEYKSFIQALLPHVAPAYLLGDYRRARYGTTSANASSASPAELIPAGFRSSYDAKQYVSRQSNATGFMQPYQRNYLRDLVARNDAAMRAAAATSGMMQYNDAGQASFAYNITPAMYDQFRHHLFDDFVRRASGKQSERINLFDNNLSQSEERRLLGRMTSSSAGRALYAMSELEKLADDKSWGGGEIGKGYQKLDNVVKSSLEQYEVAKYRFDNLFNNKVDHNLVTVSESANTRMLGLQGHHNDFTDKMLLVSLAGYDKNNEEQQKYLENLLSGQAISIPGMDKKYIAQNIHGTGSHTVLRMIEQQEYERVKKQEEAWAKEQGFTGFNFWNDFVDENFDFGTIKNLRRHYDATGKGWSPGSKMHSNFGKDFNDKKFAIVDLSDEELKKKFADGIGWFADGILPVDDAQVRLGTAGKGTLHNLKGFKTLGEWAVASGLANSDGRFIVKGPRGDIDLTDYSGMVDQSMVKNMQTYANLKTGEDLNKGFTAMLQRYGGSVMADYESAETRARGLGSQAMAFIKLSPAMQQEQINEYARRMRLLDTEAGVREYLLGDPDNYLGQQVRNGTVSIGSKLVQSWVNSERQSLMERMASGEWIDFGEQPSVINQKVNKTPIASLLGLSSNATKAEILQHIRDQYKKKKGKELQISDEELSGYFALDKGQIVDFARPEETEVSVQRSPSGLGNFVYGKNYAKGAKELYEMLGLSTSGVYLSEDDMNKLGGADFDGDAVKTLYGNIGKAVKEAAIIHDELVDRFSFIKNPETKPVELKDIEDFHDSNKHKRLFTEASIDAVPHMGSSSSSGMRATMFDLTNPQNRDYLIAAIQGNAAYVDTSAEAKNATETEVTDKMKKALGQGAQWSRLPTRFSRFFNVTGDEDIDKPNDEDIFTANVNGQEVKINMAELRDVGFDRINMRSIFSGADLGGLRAATELAKGGVDMTRAYALMQALDEGVGYGSAGPATKALMKTMRQMKVLDMVNPNRMLNDEELGRLEEMIGEAERETNRQNADKSTGEKMQALNELGITAAKNFIERGIHEKNMNALYGEENAKNDFKELYDNQTAEVVIEGNEEYRKLLAYRRMAQNVQESEEKVKDIDNAILAREEQLNKIKEKLPEKDRGRFESDMSEQEWADVSNTIFGADNTEEGYTEQQEVSRVYENARQIASAEGIDLDQTQKEISDLKNEKQEIQAQSANVGDLYGYIKAQERFNRADEFGKALRSELISNIIKKQAEVDETPEADSYFRQRMYKANTGHKIFEALKNSDDFKHKQFTAEEEEAILKAISPTEGFIAETYEDYGVTAETKAKRLFERFERQNGKTGQQGILNQQFERYDEALKDVEAYRDRIIKILNEDDLHDDVRAKLTNSLNEVEKNISKAKVEINETKDFRQRQLDESFRQREAQTDLRGQQELLQAQRAGIQVEQMNRNWQTHTLTDPFTRNYLQRRSMYDQYRGQVGNSKLQLNQAKEAQRRAREAEKLARDQEDKKNAKAQYDNASAAVSHWEEVLRSAREGMKEFGDENGEFNAAFQMTAATIETVSTAADKLIQNFGRQVLRNAFNEAKNFVVQFDSQMRTIQAITMKTDEQMQSVKQATVDRAIELRTSVANVAQVEADLYRQGLDDEQVEERSDAIIKFATVTGAKVGDAGKAITTAIQNGLVSSAEEAMDVMTALGDSAATTANEIFKGMQKSAAAAKVAGVSYDELTTLLTIGTSKTQLSGNVIGTGLQTIFSRMNRVTNEGYANDENGKTTTINDVEKALKSAGVQLRTEDGRSFRGSFDVLRDLSRVWSGLSDIQRSNVTYTMAGGRQTNMFTTLMEGMSEDGGAWLDELLGLAEGSEGTTETKYAIAAKSITASLNELKSTYDGIVENLAGGGVITSGIDMVTSLVSGFKDLTDSAPAAVAGIGLIGTAIAGLFAKIASGLAMANMASGPAGLISTLIALVAGGAMFGGVSLVGSLLKNYKESKDEGLQRQKREEAAQQFSDLQKERLKPVNDEINKVEELGKAWESAGKKSGTKEWTALSSALTSLQNQLGLTSTAFNDGSTAIDNWAASVEEARNKVNGIQQASDELTDMAKDESMRVEAEKIFSEHDKSIQFAENIGANVSTIEKGIYKNSRLKALRETGEANNLAYSAYLNQYDQKTLDELAKDNKYKLNILDGIGSYNEIYDEKAGEFTETVQGNLGKLAAIEYLDQNVFKNKNEPVTESEKQLVELWNAFTQSEVRYNNALAENRISSNDPSKWSPEETVKMYDAMINFAGSDMQTDIVLANEKFDNSKEELIRKTIKNSTQLNTLFGGNQEYLDAIAEQAVQQLSDKKFADSTDYANALTNFRQSVVEEYSGRSKEFLDKTLNYKNYDNQIEYIDSQGKKVIFGVNGNISQDQAEVLARQYEDERSEKFEPTLNVQNNIVVNVNGEQVSTTTTTTLDSGASQTTTDTEKAPSTTPAKSSGRKTYEPIATVAGGPFASDVVRPPLTDDATSGTQTKTVEELKAETQALDTAATELDNAIAETQESISEIVENVNDAEKIVANVDEVKEANNQVNQKIAETVSGVTVKRQEKKIPKLSDVIQDLSVQTQLNDLSGQYASFLNYAQQTSSFQGLENLLANNNIDPSVFKQIFSSDQTLLKMYNDSTTGGRQYTYDQFLEQLRAGALGETLSQIVPQTISEANTYNQSRAALTAVMNGTATAEQYEAVASQWGLDRNTFMANKDVYTMLEGSRLNMQKQTMEQNAQLYLQKQMDDFIKDNQEQIHTESFGKDSGTLFDQTWGEYVKTAKNQEQLDSMMKAYRAAGYDFKMDRGGQITATYNGQSLGPEDQLNPYAWNRNLGRSQARADIMEYLQNNGKLSGDNVDQRIQNMKNYSSELAQYIDLSEDARETAEGLALLEQIRIKVHVDGLDDLVALGQMSQEAVTWATQLATGGTLKFDARRAIRASTLETSQLGGLANATELTPEMRQAMMQYFKVDETTFNTEDWTEWQKELRDELSSKEFVKAMQNKYAEAYKAADDESKKLIKANAEKLGGRLVENENGTFFTFRSNWWENVLYQANESLADTTKHYTADQLQAEMNDLIAGTKTGANITDADLQNALRNRYGDAVDILANQNKYVNDPDKITAALNSVALVNQLDSIKTLSEFGKLPDNAESLAQSLFGQSPVGRNQAQAQIRQETNSIQELAAAFNAGPDARTAEQWQLMFNLLGVNSKGEVNEVEASKAIQDQLDVWITFLDKIAESNPEMKTFTDNIKTMLGGGNIGNIDLKTNLLDEHEVQLSTTSLLEYVDQLVAAGEAGEKMFGNLSKNIQQQLMNFGGLADFMKTYGENTAEAAKAQRDLTLSIVTGTLEALEQEGKIISGISGQMETLLFGNDVDRKKQTNQMIDQITEYANVREAYNRLISGDRTRQEDWDTFQGFWNISDRRLQEYQLGQRSLITDYGKEMESVTNLQQETAKNAVEAILRAEAGENGYVYDYSDIPYVAEMQRRGQAPKVKARQKTLEEMVSEMTPDRIADFNRDYSELGLSIDENGQLRVDEAALQKLTIGQQLRLNLMNRDQIIGNKGRESDAETMLNLFDTLGGNKDLLAKTVDLYQWSSSAIEELMNNEDFIEALDKGDNSTARRMIAEIGGRTLPNQTRVADVEKYISAVLSGDRETLETMTEADVKEFANNIAGFQEAYNAVMDNMTLTDEQRKTLEGGAAYQRARELEQAGTVRKGTADLASQLATGTASEQRSLIGQQASIAHESQRTVDIMDYLIEHSGESNEAMWKEFQQRENLDDDAIEHYKESTDALKRLRDEEQAEANQVVESLKAAIKSALTLDDFSDIENGLHEAFKNLLSDSLNAEGLELTIDDKGNVSIEEQKQKTPWEILTGTGQGTYNVDYETKQRRNDFVQLLRDSSSLEDFQRRYEEAAASTPWMQSKTDVRSVIGQDYATMIEQMQSGRYSWDQIQNMFTQASGYSPLYKDQKFDLGLSKMQEYFGSNFGVSDNVDFSDSSIKSFSDYVASGDGQVALDFLSQFKQGTEFLETLNSGSLDDLKSTMRALNNEIAGSKVQNLNKYKEDTEAVAQNIMDLGKNARTSVTAVGSLIGKMNQLSDKATAAQKARGKAGKDLDNKTRGVLSSATGLGEQDIKQLTADQVDQLAKMVEASAEEEFEATIGNTLAEQATRTISEALAGSNIDVSALVHFDVNGDGNFDMSELAALAQQLDDEALATLASYAGKIADLVLEYSTTADSISVEAVLHSLLGGGGYKGAGGGGGGGGGKSAAQELMEELKRAKALRDHEIKMIQYQETKYENAGEIGNQNRMIELENVAQQKLIKTLEDAINKTKQQMAQTKKGSDDWYSLYESVLTYEEGIEEANQAIADNTRKIKENEQAILKLHTDLEQAVDQEIRNRIQMQRDMLDGTVSMEDIVLEAIRQRYRDEWALIQKDIEKKKAALEEEKNLIDERLQRRKDAEDEAEKYEELAEYKRQLALISLDSTRTKDAAKLREQIANLEKEQAWNIAQDEADYQKEQIDEQIQAYDDFVTYGDEDLEEFLANANNMADEVNGVMQLSQEGMMDWLKDNVKEYALAMDDAQKQMIQGWIDTYEQMLGITHTYWDEIAQILSGKDTWLAYMQQSQEYIDASTDERAQMLYEWSEMYDNWLLAQKRDAVYSHTDDELNGTGSSGKGGGGGGKTNKDSLKVDINWPKDIELGIRNAISPGIDPNGVKPSSGTKESTAGSKVQNGKTDAIVNPLITWVNTIFGTHFDNGGLVDYTGPAWVDGTKTKPEAFLDAEDTALIRGFLDQAQYVRYRSTVSNIDSNSFGGNSQNIGEVIVNITEAQFKDDADFDEVAHRVGQQFVKEISKQGFNTMSYSF